MEKEEYRKAFKAGVEYWSWVQTDEPLLHKPIDFDEWYDTVVLPQANVVKSVCAKCGKEINWHHTECIDCLVEYFRM